MNEPEKVIDMQGQLIIKEFGIEEITTANIALMEKQILDIPEKPETKAQYDDARRFNVDAKKLLPRIEERRKELKAPVLEKCKAIDDTAKKAVAMVQPLIELSGSRRQAWEDKKADEKAEKDRLEAERMAAIQAKIDMINNLAAKPMEYNRASYDIEQDLINLEAFEINCDDFQERNGEAEFIKSGAISKAKAALENRIKFEADQAEAARVKAEQEAYAARLAEEREKLEMERKAHELAVLEASEAEAEMIRLKEEAIKAEREALEAEKAKIAREAVWDEAHQEDFDRDHEAAIIENERRKVEAQAAQADFEAAHASAILDHEAWKERQRLVGMDKLMIKNTVESLDDWISNIFTPHFGTQEAMTAYHALITNIKTSISLFEKEGEALR